jgi:predicted esterase
MLPPDYDANANKKFPVLYFLHGLGENEQALLNSGGWGLIQDLVREHKVGDFLMVAPEGRGGFFINSADGKNRYSDFYHLSKHTIGCSASESHEASQGFRWAATAHCDSHLRTQ